MLIFEEYIDFRIDSDFIFFMEMILFGMVYLL